MAHTGNPSYPGRLRSRGLWFKASPGKYFLKSQKFTGGVTLSSRVPALQARSPEFKPPLQQKQK
jgi:hypothetical protein